MLLVGLTGGVATGKSTVGRALAREVGGRFVDADDFHSAENVAKMARGEPLSIPPAETALGALLGHITGGAEADLYQPMNVNFGLFPPVEGRTKKADRKLLYTGRARAALEEWIA
jgi:folate-dependent tRNA-U54 methylase TrmFO/GidA